MAQAAAANTKWWSGGKSPFNVEYGKLMMWYFLMSDTFTFGAFLIAYGTVRMSSISWPDPNHVFNAFPGAGHYRITCWQIKRKCFAAIAHSPLSF